MANGNGGEKKSDGTSNTKQEQPGPPAQPPSYTAQGPIRGSSDYWKTAIICVLVAALLWQGHRNSEAIADNAKAIADNAKAIAVLDASLKVGLAKIGSAITSNEGEINDLTGHVDWALRRGGLRMIRLEDELKIEERPLSGATSPVILTDEGKTMLSESRMDNFLDEYKSRLMEKVKAENLPASPTVYEVEKIAIKVINNYPDFNKADAKMIEDYMFNHPIGKMFDIWEIAGIRFRDMILEDLGMPVPTEIQVKEDAPTEEKATSPP